MGCGGQSPVPALQRMRGRILGCSLALGRRGYTVNSRPPQAGYTSRFQGARLTPIALRMAPLALCAALAAAPALAQQTKDPPIPADTELQTTASGLKYSVLRAGSPGPHPKMGDKVVVHYTGWLPDGKVFDTSRGGEPAQFFLGRVVPGWNEGLQLMTPGAHYKFTVPPALGYGRQGSPPRIPPDATLIFELELLDVIAMPDFPAAHPDAQKSTASGIRYEVMEEGNGEPVGADVVYDFDYALFNPTGKLLDCSGMHESSMMARLADVQLRFFHEILPLMRTGSCFRVEVPPSLAFGKQPMGPDLPADSVTVWELKLKRVLQPLPVPAFSMPAADQLQKTASGLQYQMVQEGTGTTPEFGDQVVVHYAGWLPDGTLFDSSYGRGEPTKFRLGEVIDGWNEGLALMKEGGVCRFVIPPALAYGEDGSPPVIGPNQTLVFLVELQKVTR